MTIKKIQEVTTLTLDQLEEWTETTVFELHRPVTILQAQLLPAVFFLGDREYTENIPIVDLPPLPDER